MQSSVRLGLVGIAMATCLIAGSASAAEPAPVGYWKTIDDASNRQKSVIQIWQDDAGQVHGKIIKLFREADEEADPLCDECQGADFNKRIIGMTIMKGLGDEGDEWAGGTIMDPDNGETYKCLIEVEDGGKKLKVRGYIGFALLGRTQHWIRAR